MQDIYIGMAENDIWNHLTLYIFLSLFFPYLQKSEQVIPWSSMPNRRPLQVSFNPSPTKTGWFLY